MSLKKASGDKKVFIKSYGCQMNVYDAQKMADILRVPGYHPTKEVGDADLVILNTCHIREKATEKVFSELGRLARLKQERRDRDGVDIEIGIAGCVAQAEGKHIIERMPVVDVVVGPQSYHRLPQLLQIARKKGHALDINFPVEDKFSHLVRAVPTMTGRRGGAAFLSIQEGCDKFCTFCVVPYTRGAEFSRPVEQIVQEAQNLADIGVCELTVLGQNVNGYCGRDNRHKLYNLADLLSRLSEIVGIDRLRYTTSHPRDMDDDLISAHRDLPKLMPHLHLPVQSGSDRILKAMNRRHSVEYYVELISKIRKARPDIAVSGDFIVGFPGESENDFDQTMKLVNQIEYAQAYSFNYSPRPGTPAAEMPDQIAQEEKSRRLSVLQQLLRHHQERFNQATIGRVLPVLIERKGRYNGQIAGRTPYMQAVHISADEDCLHKILPVTITEVAVNSLGGEIALTSDIGASN